MNDVANPIAIIMQKASLEILDKIKLTKPKSTNIKSTIQKPPNKAHNNKL